MATFETGDIIDSKYWVRKLIGEGATGAMLGLSIFASRGAWRSRCCTRGSRLGTMHNARIVHRDPKPANLFLARTSHGGENVESLDFGRENGVDWRADLYSVGIILYEGVTASLPIEGDASPQSSWGVIVPTVPAAAFSASSAFSASP